MGDRRRKQPYAEKIYTHYRILSLAAQGMPALAIARALGCHHTTVSYHLGVGRKRCKCLGTQSEQEMMKLVSLLSQEFISFLRHLRREHSVDGFGPQSRESLRRILALLNLDPDTLLR